MMTKWMLGVREPSVCFSFAQNRPARATHRHIETMDLTRGWSEQDARQALVVVYQCVRWTAESEGTTFC
jgi:hypothetical protein